MRVYEIFAASRQLSRCSEDFTRHAVNFSQSRSVSVAREKWPSAAGGVTDVPRSVQQSLSRGRVLDLSQEVGDGCECEVAYVVGQLWGHVGRFEMPVAVAAGVPGAGDCFGSLDDLLPQHSDGFGIGAADLAGDRRQASSAHGLTHHSWHVPCRDVRAVLLQQMLCRCLQEVFRCPQDGSGIEKGIA